MPSPFPGFDPYLEHPRWWRGFYAVLTYAVSVELNRTLPTGFVADLRCVIEPTTGQTVERSVAVRRLGEPEETVAVVKVLRPQDKEEQGGGRAKHIRRRQRYLRNGVHFLEIDLLRQTRHLITDAGPRDAAQHQDDYQVSVYHAGTADVNEILLVSVRSPLPCVLLPLTDDAPEVPLNLQACFDHAYDAGPYRRVFRYAEEPALPLAHDDAIWADELLRTKGLG